MPMLTFPWTHRHYQQSRNRKHTRAGPFYSGRIYEFEIFPYKRDSKTFSQSVKKIPLVFDYDCAIGFRDFFYFWTVFFSAQFEFDVRVGKPVIVHRNQINSFNQNDVRNTVATSNLSFVVVEYVWYWCNLTRETSTFFSIGVEQKVKRNFWILQRICLQNWISVLVGRWVKHYQGTHWQ